MTNLSRRQFIKHCSIALGVIAVAPIADIVIPRITATAIIEGCKELNLAPRSSYWKGMILKLQPTGISPIERMIKQFRELSEKEVIELELNWWDNA